MKGLLQLIISKYFSWKLKFYFNNCFDKISKYYEVEGQIHFFKSPKVKIILRGTDTATKKEVYHQEIYLCKDFVFYFKAKHNQRVQFELILKNKGTYVKYLFFISNKEGNYLPHNQIAHAMGQIDNLLYTNSYDAFLKNYHNGFRIFEVDIQVTKDNEVILFHDLKDYVGTRWIHNEIKSLEKKEVLKFKYDNKYSVLTLNDLIVLLKKYTDVYFILDMKPLSKKLTVFERIFNIYKKQAPYIEDNFIKKIELIFFQKNKKTTEDIVLKNIIRNLKNDTNSLNRIIPQTHIDNLNIIYKYYDFPLKIWRDNHDSYKNDIKLASKNQIYNYSRNYLKFSTAEKINTKIKYYFYNVSDLNQISGYMNIGFFTDKRIHK